MPFSLYPKTYHLIIDTFRSHPEVEKVLIFGSRAMGNEKKGSDIDLAIIGEKITAKTLSSISVELNEELTIPYRIDLVNFNEIDNPDLRKHIVKEGRIFFERER